MLLCWFLTPIVLYGFGIYYEIRADNIRALLIKPEEYDLLRKLKLLDEYYADIKSLTEKEVWLKQAGIVSGIIVVLGTVAWFYIFPKKKE
jgi:hypothetical protein